MFARCGRPALPKQLVGELARVAQRSDRLHDELEPPARRVTRFPSSPISSMTRNLSNGTLIPEGGSLGVSAFAARNEGVGGGPWGGVSLNPRGGGVDG
jgi:hypothetical protein